MRMLALIMALCAPLPALALSCMAPTVEQTFTMLLAEGDPHFIVEGRLTFDPTLMPKETTAVRPPKMTRVPAEISGFGIGGFGSSGFWKHEITLEVLCFGPWCGSLPQNTWTLAFLRETKGSFALVISPCGGHHFVEPTDEQVEAAQRCMRNGTCEAP